MTRPSEDETGSEPSVEQAAACVDSFFDRVDLHSEPSCLAEGLQQVLRDCSSVDPRDLARAWWKSEKPRLRLAVALLSLAGVRVLGGSHAEEYGAYFGQILREHDDERLRALAAYVLAWTCLSRAGDLTNCAVERLPRIHQLLAPPEVGARDVADLLRVLVSSSQADALVPLLRHADTSPDRARVILESLLALPCQSIHWEQWRPLVTDKTVEPQTRLGVLRLFAGIPSEDHLADFAALAEREDLPSECKVILFRVLWHKASFLDHRTGHHRSVLDVLLNLGRQPGVADHVFSLGFVSRYPGANTEETRRRVLEQVRDTALPLAYRYGMSHAVFGYAALDPHDLQLIAELWFQTARALDEIPDAKLARHVWNEIGELGKSHPSVARYLCEDVRVPIDIRWVLLGNVPRQSILRFVCSLSKVDSVFPILGLDALRPYIADHLRSIWDVYRRGERDLQADLRAAPGLLSDDPTGLVEVCSDPGAPASLRWLACEWACQAGLPADAFPTGDVPREAPTLSLLALWSARAVADVTSSRRIGAVISQGIRQSDPDAPDIPFLVGFLSRHNDAVLAAISADEALPLKRRFQILELIAQDLKKIAFGGQWGMKISPVNLTWAHWRDIILESRHPEICRKMIRLFSRQSEGDHWPELLQLAGRSSLPIPVREELFSSLWCEARQIEARPDCSEAVLATLLRLGASLPSDLVSGALGGAPGYRGKVDSDGVAQILAVLRHPDASRLYCLLLAEAIPSEASLSLDDRRTVVEALAWGVSTVDRANEKSRWIGKVSAHACREPHLARELILDEQFPFALRAQVLSLADRATLFRFLRETDVSHHVRELEAPLRACLRKVVSPYVLDAISTALREHNSFWDALMSTPALCSDDLHELASAAADPATDTMVRKILQYCALREARSQPDGTSVLLRSVIDRLSRPDFDSDDMHYLGTFLDRVLSDPFVSAQDAAIVLDAYANATISVASRLALLDSFPYPFVHNNVTRLWEVSTHSEDRPVRAATFEKLVQDAVFLTSADASAKNTALWTARSPEEVARAEKEWEPIARLGTLLEADVVTLIEIARDAEEPEVVRINAAFRIGSGSPDFGTSRHFWAYLTSPRGQALWRDPAVDLPLLQSVGGKIARFCQDRDVREILRTGNHLDFRRFLVEALAQLALLPDQSLAQKALHSVRAPVFETWEQWQDLTVDLSPLTQLLLHNVVGITGTRQITALVRAFAEVKGSHTRTADLSDALARAVAARPNVRLRISDVLSNCVLVESSTPTVPGRLAEACACVIRFAHLEAQLVAQTVGDSPGDLDREPDLPSANHTDLTVIPPDSALDFATAKLRGAITTLLQPVLPGVDAASLDHLLQATVAPAIIAVHYQKAHPQGLPLLSQAVRAHLAGPSGWQEWRYGRPGAQRQLPHLDPEQRALWRKNLETAVGFEEVPDEVSRAARQIRDRLNRVVQAKEIPDEYQSLLGDVLKGMRQPAEQIRQYERTKSVIGRLIGGAELDTSSEDWTHCPEGVRQELETVLRRNENVADSRQFLLILRHRLDRAVDLLRLLYCDEPALARNALLAVGERHRSTVRAEGAVARVEQLLYAFSRPPTRRQQAHAGATSRPLREALADVHNAVTSIKNFATTRELLAVECDDFKTLIEIGHNPYGQGSCQNYASRSSYNHALLAYAVDAMTKAIVIRTRPATSGPLPTLLARAIVRLGMVESSREPVILLERTYAGGGEVRAYDPLMKRAAREFAARRGWPVLVPEDTQDNRNAQVLHVAIPASQNGVQYEDGWRSMIESPNALAKDGYVLRAVLLE